uniref:Uncharacterized protein n=1 Tax=mine drainage metagenome TaxID=410659 RepID=E6QHV5_9ZZZZ
MYGLDPVPFSEMSFSAACEARTLQEARLIQRFLRAEQEERNWKGRNDWNKYLFGGV